MRAEKVTLPHVMLGLFTLTTLIFLFAEVKYHLGFYLIDGVFQNTNSLQRLKLGQLPFRDFYQYLGLGPLYLGGLATLPLTSVDAFSTTLAYFLCSYSLFAALIWVITGGFGFSARARATFVVAGLYLIFVYGGKFTLLKHIRFSIEPGASTRFIRASIVTIACVLCQRINRSGCTAWTKTILFGVLAAFGFLWSNDFGLPTLFVLTIAQAVRFTRGRDWLAHGSAYGATFLAATFAIGQVATGGNFWRMLRYNFRDVAGDQFWYYESVTTKGKFLMPADLIHMRVMLAAAAVLFAYAYGRRAKYVTDPNGSKIFLLTGTFAGAALASLGGGYQPTYFGAFWTVALTVLCCEVYRVVRRERWSHWYARVRWPLLVIMMLNLCWVSYGRYRKKRQFIPAMNLYSGHKFDNYEAVALPPALKGRPLISAYTSLLDAAEGQRNPVGFDYLIHALGTDNRATYLRSLVDRPEAIYNIPREDFTLWASWARQTNWYVYGYLYRNYDVAGETLYSQYWTRRAEPRPTAPATCAFDDATGVVSVTPLRPPTGEMIAEVTVSYDVEKPFWVPRHLVTVHQPEIENQMPDFGLPPRARDWSFPIRADRAGRYSARVVAYPTPHARFKNFTCRADLVPDASALYAASINRPYPR